MYVDGVVDNRSCLFVVVDVVVVVRGFRLRSVVAFVCCHDCEVVVIARCVALTLLSSSLSGVMLVVVVVVHMDGCYVEHWP